MSRINNRFITSGSATVGQVLTADGAGDSSWLNISGTSAFAAYASSQVTTDSSALTGGSFATFSNSPAFTFTPTVTGTYKVYTSAPFLDSASQFKARVFNTSGGATLLQESQAGLSVSGGAAADPSLYMQSVYTLTAGTTYVFDIQAAVSVGSTTLAGSTICSFYMFAEGISLSSPVQSNVIAASIYLASNYSVVANNPIKYDTVLFDSNNAYNSSTGQYTIPATGYYEVSATGSPTLTTFGMYVQKNSTKFSYLGVPTATINASGSTVIFAATGDTIQINSDSTVTVAGTAAPYANSFSIVQIAAPSTAGIWTAYTPTFTGMGTVSTQTFWYKLEGDSIFIKGTWTTGTPSATQARISLPSGYTIQSSKVNGSNELCGYMTTGNQNTAAFTVLIQPSVTYLTFGFNNNGTGGVNPDLGSTIFAAGVIYSFSTTGVPIS